MSLPFLPEEASAFGPVLDAVLVSIHVHILVIGAAWCALFVWLLVRFRRSRQPAARYRGIGGVLPLVAIGAVIAGDVLILATSALPAWRARTTPPPAAAGAVEVRVIGEQFAWNIQYPGQDGVFGRTRATLLGATNPLGIDRTDPAASDDIGRLNTLVVPVGRTIVVHLSSRDVVHGFSLLEMRVKQDATPGMTVTTWFTPTRTGSWQIGCSQLCGLGHYRMRGTLTVMSAEDWQGWVEENGGT